MTARLALAIGLLVASVTPAGAGYVHYFEWAGAPDPRALEAYVTDVRRLLDASADLVVGPDGTGDPVIRPRGVTFNGRGAEAHEPFDFPGRERWNGCKTNWKPYDEVVVAALLLARRHFPAETLRIGSDGTWRDWRKGAARFERVFGKAPVNPLGWEATVLEWYGFLVGWLPLILVIGVFLMLMRQGGGRRMTEHLRRGEEHMARQQQHMAAVEASLARLVAVLERIETSLHGRP